jgi:hypothetical protein
MSGGPCFAIPTPAQFTANTINSLWWIIDATGGVGRIEWRAAGGTDGTVYKTDMPIPSEGDTLRFELIYSTTLAGFVLKAYINDVIEYDGESDQTVAFSNAEIPLTDVKRCGLRFEDVTGNSGNAAIYFASIEVGVVG